MGKPCVSRRDLPLQRMNGSRLRVRAPNCDRKYDEQPHFSHRDRAVPDALDFRGLAQVLGDQGLMGRLVGHTARCQLAGQVDLPHFS